MVVVCPVACPAVHDVWIFNQRGKEGIRAKTAYEYHPGVARLPTYK